MAETEMRGRDDEGRTQTDGTNEEVEMLVSSTQRSIKRGGLERESLVKAGWIRLFISAEERRAKKEHRSGKLTTASRR